MRPRIEADGLARLEHRAHRVGQRVQRRSKLVTREPSTPTQPRPSRSRAGTPRRSARRTPWSTATRHLDIAAVGRVEHTVGLVDEVAVATVDDRDHRRATCAAPGRRSVGVGGRAALADGDDQRVGHVGRRARSPTARWPAWDDSQRLDDADAAVERRGETLTGNRRGALADDDDPADRAGREPGRGRGGHRLRRRAPRCEPAVALDELAAQGLAERDGRLGDLLEQIVRVLAAVDVARGDLRVRELGLVDREVGAVVGEAGDAGELPARAASSTTICPRLAGLSGLAGVSPSRRR